MAVKRGGGEAAAIGPQKLEARLAPMQSAVKWALLGLVIERPVHGYELARRFDRDYGDQLALSGVSYVYRALDALQRRGLIDALPEEPARRLPKIRYRATEKGEIAFQQHLMGEMIDVGHRRRLFFRKLACFAAQPERALEIVTRVERASLAQKDRTLPITSAQPSVSSEPHALAARFHAEGRRLALTATLAWLQYAREELEALAASSSVDEPS
jgi:PadR family transcriptional regulator, regulatory protein AphA